MTPSVRRAIDTDRDPMAALAATHQRDPALSTPYLTAGTTSIAADIAEVDDWAATTAVAEQAAGEAGAIVGWLLGEIDVDMGRVWWWGPFAPLEQWDPVADELYAAARELLPPGIVEEEGCGHVDNARIAAWCARHGMRGEPASAVLSVDRRVVAPGTDAVRPMAPPDHACVMELHDRYFPRTHTPPDALVGASGKLRLVVEHGGRVAGYAAAEMHSDGSGYLDFLAVDEAVRGAGLGSALVAATCDALFDRGADRVHLTVREENHAARALYAKLGFVEESVARPYRKGFTLHDL